MKVVRVLLIAALIGAAFYFGSQSRLLTLVEREQPTLGDAHVPQGFGVGATPLLVTIVDVGAGLSSVRVSIVQGERSRLVYEKQLPMRDTQHVVETQIENLRKEFSGGPAELVVEAVDASLWANTMHKNFSIVLDFEKPQISVLSQQHVAHQGGTEFVLLEARDSQLEEVGVQVGPYAFKAVPAELFDAALQGRNLYATLIALPLEIEEPLPQAFAEDAAGNRSEVAVTFPIKDYRQPQTTPAISSGFVDSKVQPLFEEFREIEEIAVDTSDPVQVFRAVNEQYRAHLQQRLAALPLAEAAVPMTAFAKPMASATTSNFGELRSYTVDGKDAGGSRHDGLDLASVLRDSVVSAHDGTVVLAEPFGIYGQTVVIDHGMGLTSLYGHLSSISVSTGDTVRREQEIGRSGETGLAGGDHLHFEFRVGQVPVDPKEWWDQHWIDDNIVGKIAALRESFGISGAVAEGE